MVGLVVFGHGSLARTFLEVLDTIVGPQEQMASVDVETATGPEEVERKLDQAIQTVNRGDGVVILADLFGGSPANFSLARMVPNELEVVSGLNLAMLLKAVDLRSRKLTDAAVMARAIAREGRDNIVLASSVLSRERARRSSEPAGGAYCPR